MESYTVIRDTREQTGFWDFSKRGQCLGTIGQKLDTGDYSLVGYEDVFTIERKNSTGELAGNITEGRFERELQRMEAFRYPFLFVECLPSDILSFPVNSGIPKHKWKYLKITPQFLMKRLQDFQVLYRTKIFLVGQHGKDFASSLFKRVVEHCPRD